jgi:hypothetical protein
MKKALNMLRNKILQTLLDLRTHFGRSGQAQKYAGDKPPLRSELFSSDQMMRIFAGHPLLYYFSSKRRNPFSLAIFLPLAAARLMVGCARFSFLDSATVVIPNSRVPQ